MIQDELTMRQDECLQASFNRHQRLQRQDTSDSGYHQWTSSGGKNFLQPPDEF